MPSRLLFFHKKALKVYKPLYGGVIFSHLLLYNEGARLKKFSKAFLIKLKRSKREKIHPKGIFVVQL